MVVVVFEVVMVVVVVVVLVVVVVVVSKRAHATALICLLRAQTEKPSAGLVGQFLANNIPNSVVMSSFKAEKPRFLVTQEIEEALLLCV